MPLLLMVVLLMLLLWLLKLASLLTEVSCTAVIELIFAVFLPCGLWNDLLQLLVTHIIYVFGLPTAGVLSPLCHLLCGSGGALRLLILNLALGVVDYSNA